ncbi:hypothetical protein DFJ73DRAFT_440680 [Zopfochytrium polystomum]|nr:hypothetical protein DFJ73DRAFT_440680 [Zopfochytrium polystomum]
MPFAAVEAGLDTPADNTASTAYPNLIPGQPRQDRALINPKFDGYKLDFGAPEQEQSRVRSSGLPNPSVISLFPSGSEGLSFRRLEARVRFNHLFADPFQHGLAYFFDCNYKLIMVDTDLRQHVVCEIPFPLAAQSRRLSRNSSPNLEAPSLEVHARDTLVVSDGAGSIYVIKLPLQQFDVASKPSATLIGPCSFAPNSEGSLENSVGRVLIGCNLVANDDGGDGPMAVDGATPPRIWVLAQHIVERPQSSGPPLAGDLLPRPGLAAPGETFRTRSVPGLSGTSVSGSRRSTGSTTFVLELIRIDLLEIDGPRAIIVSSTEGPAAPHCAFFDRPITRMTATPSFIVLADGSFRLATSGAAEPPRSTLSDVDTAPIPSPSTIQQTGNPGTRTPVYAWYQTATDVTIVIALPLPLTARRVRCVMTATGGVTLSIPTGATSTSLSHSSNLAGFPGGPFYDAISPSDSLWTLEEGGRVLSLHIHKRHAGTRWPHLWALESNSESDESGYGVEETVDPSEVASFLERMEMYTSGTDGEGGSRVGADRIATTEPVEEEDFEGDRAIAVRFGAADGGIELTQLEVVRIPGSFFMCAGMRPLYSATSAQSGDTRTVCFRSDVDGLVYAVGSVASGSTSNYSKIGFKHLATLDAMGYILASKRDKKFVTFTRDFSHALIVESGGRLYSYERAIPRKQAVQARQIVIELGSPSMLPKSGPGDVAGILELMTSDGNKVILILQEQALQAVLLT